MRTKVSYLIAGGCIVALTAFFPQEQSTKLQAADHEARMDLNSAVVEVLNRQFTFACGNCKDSVIYIGPDPYDFHLFPDIGEPESDPEAARDIDSATETVGLRKSREFSTTNELLGQKACYADDSDSNCHSFFIEGDCDWHPGCEDLSTEAIMLAQSLERSDNFAAIMHAVAGNPRLSVDIGNNAILVADCSGRAVRRFPLQASIGVTLREWRALLT